MIYISEVQTFSFISSHYPTNTQADDCCKQFKVLIKCPVNVEELGERTRFVVDRVEAFDINY